MRAAKRRQANDARLEKAEISAYRKRTASLEADDALRIPKPFKDWMTSPEGWRWNDRSLANDPCVYCSRLPTPDDPNTRDHIRPKSRGGVTENNIAPACEHCNLLKDSEHLLFFLLERSHIS